MQIIH